MIQIFITIGETLYHKVTLKSTIDKRVCFFNPRKMLVLTIQLMYDVQPFLTLQQGKENNV